MDEIELVIKIPKELYKQQLSSDWTGNILIHDAIVNGTPLPKGHGDLIDRKELLKQPMDTANYPSNYVRVAPTIIEANN